MTHPLLISLSWDLNSNRCTLGVTPPWMTSLQCITTTKLEVVLGYRMGDLLLESNMERYATQLKPFNFLEHSCSLDCIFHTTAQSFSFPFECCCFLALGMIAGFLVYHCSFRYPQTKINLVRSARANDDAIYFLSFWNLFASKNSLSREYINMEISE